MVGARRVLRPLLAALALSVLLVAPSVSGLTVDYCFAEDEDEGFFTATVARAFVLYSSEIKERVGKGEAILENRDEYIAAASEMIYEVDYDVKEHHIIGVEPKQIFTYSFPEEPLADRVNVTSKGYVGSLDTIAMAIALWNNDICMMSIEPYGG